MGDDNFQPNQSWAAKFRDAFRGVGLAIRGHRSFAVHLPAAAVVVWLGFQFQVGLVEWGLLILSITTVLVAEMFNSALESLAKAIDRKHNPQLGAALDMAAAAVLTAALVASAVGAIVFLQHLHVLGGF